MFLSHEYTQLLVRSYIRKVQSVFNDQIIPEEIDDICFQFYFLSKYHYCIFTLLMHITHYIQTEFIMDSSILTDEEKFILYELLEIHKKDIGHIFSRFYQGTHHGFEYGDVVPLRKGKENTFTLIQTDSST